MTPSELSLLDATAQRDLVRSGEVRPADLVEAALGGIDAVNGELNAVIHRRDERARSEAEGSGPLPDGPLAGVPVVIKDLDGYLAGEPWHGGSAHLRDVGFVPTETSVAIQRLIDAGAIIVGKTNTPEFGLVPSTEPVSGGPTRNPWDTTRSAAGSSGGSAAAVASGMVAIGHAGDGGGSIRLPASVCGLVGLKPSRGRVPTAPEVEPWDGLVARLAVTRSVRDTALVLDVMGAPDPAGSPVCSSSGAFSAEVGADPGSLRIGVLLDAVDGTPVDPACAAVARRTAELLAELGHRVSDDRPEVFGDAAAAADLVGDFLTAMPVWTRAGLDTLGAMCGAPFTPEGMEPHTAALFDSADTVGSVAYRCAVDRLHQFGRRVRSWWADGFDLLVTPTVPELPWTLGQFVGTADNPLGPLFRSAPIVTFATPFNISGQPAISLPVGESDGLPVGVQLVAGWGREDLLIRVAAQLEEAVGWSQRRPGVHVSTAGPAGSGR